MPESQKSLTQWERPRFAPIGAAAAIAMLPLVAFNVVHRLSVAEFMVCAAAIIVVSIEVYVARGNTARMDAAIKRLDQGCDSLDTLHANAKARLDTLLVAAEATVALLGGRPRG